MSAQLLQPAFTDPVLDAQRGFRAALKALAGPGLIQTLHASPGIEGLAPATYALCLALLDVDTPLWLAPSFDTPVIRANLAFHCGCPLTADRKTHGLPCSLTTTCSTSAASTVAMTATRISPAPCWFSCQCSTAGQGWPGADRGSKPNTWSACRWPTASGASANSATNSPVGWICFSPPAMTLSACRAARGSPTQHRSVPDVRSRQGWRTGHRQCPPSAGEKTPGRYLGHRTERRANPPATAAGRGAGDERRLAVRRRTGRTGDQASGGRSGGSDLPAARLSHHVAAFQPEPADRYVEHAAQPASVRDLQGCARRAIAGADLRLHPSLAGLCIARRRRIPGAADHARTPASNPARGSWVCWPRKA